MPRPIEDQEALLDENGLRDDRANTTWAQESGERSDDINEKDEEIAHHSSKNGYPPGIARQQQFVIDTSPTCSLAIRTDEASWFL